jgi:hypothetical protein
MTTVEYIVSGSGVWLDSSEANMADCVVKFSSEPEPVPFTAVRDDIYDYAEQVLDMLIAGEAGPVKPYADYLAEVAAATFEAEKINRVKLLAAIAMLDPDGETDLSLNPENEDVFGDGLKSNAELDEIRLELRGAA